MKPKTLDPSPHPSERFSTHSTASYFSSFPMYPEKIMIFTRILALKPKQLTNPIPTRNVQMRLTAAIRGAVIHRQTRKPRQIRIDRPPKPRKQLPRRAERKKPQSANSELQRGIEATSGADRRGRRECREDPEVDRGRERERRWQQARAERSEEVKKADPRAKPSRGA